MSQTADDSRHGERRLFRAPRGVNDHFNHNGGWMASKRSDKAAPRRTVADLLKARADASSADRFTPEQFEQVRLALEFNDAEPNVRRHIGSRVLHRLLCEDYGFTGGGVDTLERWTREAFSRASWGKK